jgi:hypothetical protein
MQEESPQLTDRQINFAVRCASQWIEIYRHKQDHGPTAADADHSSLLRRLLSGKPALPDPPPLRYSYPDYGLAEGEPTEVREVWDRDPARDGDVIDECGGVVIDQGGDWDWADKAAGMLVHRPTGHTYRLREEPRTRKRLGRHGGPFEEIPYIAKILQRVMEAAR